MSSCSVQAIWNQSIVSLQEHIVNSYLSTFPPFQQGKYCNFLAPCNIRLLVWLKSIIYLQENNTIGDTALYRKNITVFEKSYHGWQYVHFLRAYGWFWSEKKRTSYPSAIAPSAGPYNLVKIDSIWLKTIVLIMDTVYIHLLVGKCQYEWKILQ